MIRDQVTKLKHDHVEGEEEERKEEQEGLAFSAIEIPEGVSVNFAHPEALVGKKNVIKLLKTAEFRGAQREYSSKPLKHSIVKRILVFKR